MEAVIVQREPAPRSAIRGLVIAVALEMAAGGLGFVTVSWLLLA